MAISIQTGQVAVAGLQPVLSLREELGFGHGSGDVGSNLLFDRRPHDLPGGARQPLAWGSSGRRGGGPYSATPEFSWT